MAHKVMVDGTVYDVTGGKTLIDGTQYSIKNGKTMADGTVYEIGFGLAMPMITIGASASDGTDEYQAEITLTFPEAIEHPLMNGYYTESLYLYASSSYDGLAFEVPVGTLADCKVSSSYGTPSITLNGTSVSSKYTHTISKNVGFDLKVKRDGGKGVGLITITET